MENAIPADGDNIILGVGGLNKVTTNDIIGLDLLTIDATTDGYSVLGNSFRITDFIASFFGPYTLTIDADVTLADGTIIGAYEPDSSVVFTGSVTVESGTIQIQGNSPEGESEVVFTSTVAGDFTTLNINNSANVNFMSTNLFNATIFVASGNILCQDPLCFGDPINLVDVQFSESSLYFDISGSAVINNNFALDGNLSAIPVIINDGDNLEFIGNIVTQTDIGIVSASGITTFSGVISGTGNLLFSGETIVLSGDNTYTGLTFVDYGELYVDHQDALGDPDVGTFVCECGTLTVNGDFIFAEDLALTGYGFDGKGSLRSYFSPTLTGSILIDGETVISSEGTSESISIDSAISGNGTFIKQGLGTVEFSGSANNTYVGGFEVHEGTVVLNRPDSTNVITGNVIVGDGFGGTNSDVLVTLYSSLIVSTSLIEITDSGKFEMNADFQSIYEVTGGGHLAMGDGQLAFDGNPVGFEFDGTISGGGEILFYDNTLVKLTNNNVFGGDYVIKTGTLFLNGYNNNATAVVDGGTVRGGGSVMDIISESGHVRPGINIGTLTVVGEAKFDTGVIFHTEIDGPLVGTGYDQLRTVGPLDIDDATLEIELDYAPNNGTVFTIVDAQGGYTGTFSGLPNGSLISFGPYAFIIRYNFFTITLTAINYSQIPTTVDGEEEPTGTPTPTPTLLPSPIISTPSPTPEETKDDGENTTGGVTGNSSWNFCLIGLILLAIIGGIIFFARKKKQEQEVSQKEYSKLEKWK